MHEPSLETLAVEIHDGAMLLAPRGWARVQIRLERGADGRPQVIDLVSTPRDENATPRAKPDLGVDVGVYFGNLNEALGDVARLARDLGVRWTGAAVAVSRDGDDDTRLELLGDDARPQHEVVLRSGVLEHLIFTDPLFDALDMIAGPAESAQSAIRDEVLGHDEWNYDAAAGELSLSRGSLPWRTYRAAVVGTYAFESESWRWAWSNPSLAPGARRPMERVRDRAATMRGLGVLLRPGLPCDEALAARLAWLASHLMGGRGIYAASYGPGSIFYAIEPPIDARSGVDEPTDP